VIDRYSRPALRTLFSEQTKIETWLSVELAACRAMEQLGLVPAGIADKIAGAVHGKLDPRRVAEIEERTRHDVIAFLTHVEELTGPESRYLHLGLTSSDVLDTATAIILDKAFAFVEEGIQGLRAALAEKARAHRSTPMIGRSHGIHAEPITAGVMFAGFVAETDRNVRRLRAARERARVGKIAGAVGVYGSGDPEIERIALATLGLRPETVATQVVARDRHAGALNALAMIGAGVERFAVTVRHLMRTEVAEVEEAFGRGQKGSSAMPHKKNPILSENLTGIARLLRAYSMAGLEDVALWHERDISHSSVERMALPDAFSLCDFMLQRATGLVSGLVVHEARMLKNLETTGGLVFSEAIMLALIDTGLRRQEAYEIVQRSALKARDEGGRFQDLLAADAELTARLPAERLAACFDLTHHLRHCGTIVDRALVGEGS
jgi:adenylosuccinate lyase